MGMGSGDGLFGSGPYGGTWTPPSNVSGGGSWAEHGWMNGPSGGPPNLGNLVGGGLNAPLAPPWLRGTATNSGGAPAGGMKFDFASFGPNSPGWANLPPAVQQWITSTPNWFQDMAGRPPFTGAPPPRPSPSPLGPRPGVTGWPPGVAGPTLSGRQPLAAPSSLSPDTLARMTAMTAAANARGASGPGGWGSARPDVVGTAAPVSTMTGSGFDASGSLLRRSGPAPTAPPQGLKDKINAALVAAGQAPKW